MLAGYSTDMTTTAATAPTATADSYAIAFHINGERVDGRPFCFDDETITAGGDYDLGDPLTTVADWLAGFVLENRQAESDETVTDSVRADILSPAGDVLASGFRNVHHLFDTHTAEDLGPATPEQVAASDEAFAKDACGGGFLIDADGDVVGDGSWGAQQPGVRSVYTEVA